VTRYLTVEQAPRIARAAVGGPIEVRDVGLQQAARLARHVGVPRQERHGPRPDDDGAYQLVVDVAAGAIDDVDSIAAALASFSVRASD
jgi:hypothetical protein